MNFLLISGGWEKLTLCWPPTGRNTKWRARHWYLSRKGLIHIPKILIEFVWNNFLSVIFELLYENDSFSLEGLQFFIKFLMTPHILRLFLLVSNKSLWYSFSFFFLRIVVSSFLHCIYEFFIKTCFVFHEKFIQFAFMFYGILQAFC